MFTAADVTFEQNSYMVEEGAGFVMVCMVISGLVEPIMSDLWVDISTAEITDSATCKFELANVRKLAWCLVYIYL